MPQNLILNTILERHPEVHSHVKRIDCVHGDLFGRPGEPIKQVIFPASGMVSIVVGFACGDLVEAAMVGRNGVVGASAAFGAIEHIDSSFCQIPGAAHLLPVDDLKEIARRDDDLRAILYAHQQFMLVQAQQTAACNARHQTRQRLAGWLLRVRDITGLAEMMLTQDSMAQMLGTQRATVSVLAGQLQDMDLIRYRRGRLSIVDELGLIGQACECHDRLAAFHNRQFRDGEPVCAVG